MSLIRLAPLTLGLGLLVAAEGEAPVPTPSPDPSAAVVAEGTFLYRQRDLDAFLAIARRHNGRKLSRAEEDQVRQALIVAFTAREDLARALTALPASLDGPARDRLVLDLLDFQGEPIPPRPLTPENAAPAQEPAAPATGTPAPAPVPEAKPATAGDAPAGTVAPDPASPVIVRLPQLVLPRTFPDLGKRTLTLSLAFTFTDGALAERLQNQAPLIQDAILTYLHGLDADAFTKPSQPALKAGIDAAIRAKVPTFPADAVLIPELEAGAAAAPDKP